MRILLVNYEFPPLGGGGGVASYELAREWAKSNRVDCLTTWFKNLKKREVVEGVKAYRVRVLGRKDLSTATLLSMLSFPVSSLIAGIRMCRKNRYDVINTHFTIPSGPSGILLSKIFRIPHVLSIHGGDIYDPSKRLSPHRSWLLRKIVNWVMNSSDAIIAQSSNTKKNARKYFSPKKEIKIIPLAFTPPKFRKAGRKELGLEDGKTYLISVGRLIKRKGYSYLIRALSEIKNRKVELLLLGDGPEEEDLRALASKLGVKERVHFLGFVKEERKFQYLNASDIYVLSSLHEGFGIVLQEAMHCGLPIVSTDNGGQTDFLTDRKNALLVPIRNSRKMVEAIKKLAGNSKLRKSMSRNNRKDIKKFYAGKIASRYMKIFETLAGKGNGRKKQKKRQ